MKLTQIAIAMLCTALVAPSFAGSHTDYSKCTSAQISITLDDVTVPVGTPSAPHYRYKIHIRALTNNRYWYPMIKIAMCNTGTCVYAQGTQWVNPSTGYDQQYEYEISPPKAIYSRGDYQNSLQILIPEIGCDATAYSMTHVV